MRWSIKADNTFASSCVHNTLFTSSPAGNVTLVIVICGNSCFRALQCFAVAVSPDSSPLSIRMISCRSFRLRIACWYAFVRPLVPYSATISYRTAIAGCCSKLTASMMLSVRISFIVADFVYTAIGLQPAHYNELGKGLVEQSIEILDKLAEF